MKLKYAAMGLMALSGVVLGAASASAMPNGLASGVLGERAGVAEQVRLVCDRYGRCWRTPGYGPRYGYAPRYGYGPRYGYYGGPRVRPYRYGYRRW